MYLEKKKGGKSKRVDPYVNVGKSGEGLRPYWEEPERYMSNRISYIR